MLQTLLTPLKEILNLDSNKRSIILSWLFSGAIIWYLYNSNTRIQEKLDNIEKINKEEIVKLQLDCNEQLKINRSQAQKQINDFITESNIERDSIYKHFYKVIRSYNLKINQSIEDINRLKR